MGYVKGIAETYGVRKAVEFETKLLGMVLDEGSNESAVRTEKAGEKLQKRRYDVVVNCAGCLNNWKLPYILASKSLGVGSCIVQIGT